MKKKFCSLFLVLFVGLTAFGQSYRPYYLKNHSDENKFIERNEIRVNLLMSVIGLPEINYERFIEDNFGLGVAGTISLDKPNDNYFRGSILPFARLYFGDRPASGFFIEGNTGLTFQKKNNYSYYYSDYSNPYNVNQTIDTNTYIGYGIGVAVGYKFLSRNNWVGEFHAGVGRIFGVDNISEAYPRVGITIGKRF